MSSAAFRSPRLHTSAWVRLMRDLLRSRMPWSARVQPSARSRVTREALMTCPVSPRRPAGPSAQSRTRSACDRLVDDAGESVVIVGADVRHVAVEGSDLADLAAVLEHQLQTMVDLPLAVALQRDVH